MHLVESYRRARDGRPTHRVLANLGPFDERVFANLKAALEASRLGAKVVVAKAPRLSKPPPKPTANLRYLDLAVFLSLWKQWGLDKFFRDLWASGSKSVEAGSVVAALVLQRCVCPHSKLAATRWFPRTALPELLGIAPKQFNNTRVHRVMTALEQATPALMGKLPHIYRQRGGAFVSLFLDVTDTWFEGKGPPSAGFAKTKEGILRTKIGIVLLCNERGYPLRWQVISGQTNDSVAMTEMFKDLHGLPWVEKAPIVVDRAMGNTAHIRAMHETGLRFVTALVKSEFGNYAPNLPHQCLDDMGMPDDSAEFMDRVVETVQSTGMTKAADNLFFTDLGVVTYAGEDKEKKLNQLVVNGKSVDRTIYAMRQCRNMVQWVADGRASSLTAAAKALGLGSSGVVWKYLSLRHLAHDIQDEILEGRAAGRTLVELKRIASLKDAPAQRKAFEALLDSPSPPARPDSVVSQRDASTQPDTSKPLRVRAALYFNPERFVTQRRNAYEKVKAIERFFSTLNTQLASPRSRRSKESLLGHIHQRLRRDDLLEAFQVEVVEAQTHDRTHFQIQHQLDQRKWKHRRRYDGFTVLVAHPDVQQTALELSALYRAKDSVEKDFQVIKSQLEVRPVRHYTNDKVRAHVTICMLALLLERTLRVQLKSKYSVQQALEALDVRLNRYKADGNSSVFTVTELTREQRAILKTLRLSHLGHDDHVAELLAPIR